MLVVKCQKKIQKRCQTVWINALLLHGTICHWLNWLKVAIEPGSGKEKDYTHCTCDKFAPILTFDPFSFGCKEWI